MAIPATTGVLRTNIADMEIGDYILTTFSSNGSTTQPSKPYYVGNEAQDVSETPLTGENPVISNAYFIKVDTGLLIADRVIQNSISWDTLNSGNGARFSIQGYSSTVGGINGKIRSLTGGVAYADANGNKSTSDLGFGAFPTNNEWDKYVVNFPSELIQSGKTLDDVFHWSAIYTWTQDTPTISIDVSTDRCRRGNISSNFANFTSSSTASASVGFRPVFQYKES